MLSLLFVVLASSFVPPNEERMFISWMKEHNYVFVGNEYRLRLGIYMGNARRVAEHGSTRFTMRLNKFAATTPSEYHARLGAVVTGQRGGGVATMVEPPESIDWRQDSYVPDVVDCGMCASWAVASVVPLSHRHFVNTSEKVTFSRWNLIDCDPFCRGCQSGGVEGAWMFIKENMHGKINTLEDYDGKEQGMCRYVSEKAVYVMDQYAKVNGIGNETELAAACATYGPVVALIDASAAAFQLYGNGVFDDGMCSCLAVNHHVSVVGYGSSDQGEYWICQNAWGATWGENGYIRMIRGKNLCGIASYAWHLVG